MDEYLKLALPAVIALVGSILVVWLGYRQFRSTQTTSLREKYQSDRYSAYKDLWSFVEGIQSDLRSGILSQVDFNERTRLLNDFILKNGIFLEKQDSSLASQYVESLYQLNTRVIESGTDYVAQFWVSTLPFDAARKLEEKYKDVIAAWRAMNQLRERLIQRMHYVMQNEAPMRK